MSIICVSLNYYQAHNLGISYETWGFFARHAEQEQRNFLVQIFCSLQIYPLESQIVLGLESVTSQDLERLPRIPHNDLEKLRTRRFFSSYLILVKFMEGGLPTLYNGSATGTSGSKGLVGESHRIFNGHEDICKSGCKEIQRMRLASDTKALHIYEHMTYAGASYSYHQVARIPHTAQIAKL